MKKKIIIHDRYGVKEKEIDCIPVRFIIAILLIIFETAAVITVALKFLINKWQVLYFGS